MKKGLLYLSCLMMCVLGCLSSCKDDEKPEVPPVVADILAQYTGDKLKANVDGASVSGENVQIDLLQMDDKSLTIKLVNVIPGVKEFLIPNAEFEAATRSIYVSKLKGKASDVKIGYEVVFDGIVDEGVLTANVTSDEIEGDSISVKKAGLISKTFKGKMGINVSNIPSPIEMEQRVYTSAAANRDSSSIKLQIKNFSFQGLSLGDISLDNILVVNRSVQQEKTVYGFKTVGQKMVLQAVGEVSIDAKGTIIGDQMALELDVNAISASLKVNVDFNGNIVTESTDTKATITVTGAAVAEGVTASGNTYTFKAWDGDPKLLVLTPVIEIPKTAVLDSIVIYNASNKKVKSVANAQTPIDFSEFQDGYYVGYHITPEDVRYPTKKMLKVELILENLVFDMQTWVNGDGDKPTPKGLSNSNMAAAFFPVLGINVPVPVVEAGDKSAEITTSRTVNPSNLSPLIPGVTAGTLFLGQFKLDIFNTLKSTLFGAPYRSKPVGFKITYKYTPGQIYYKSVPVDGGNDTQVVSGEKDECSINAYLYEVASYAESLDGTNINTSNKVIMKAVLADGTAKADYTTQTISFVETGNGTYDASKKYKLAIVCSSSKKGDQFMGADGSKLWVKHLEVTK